MEEALTVQEVVVDGVTVTRQMVLDKLAEILNEFNIQDMTDFSQEMDSFAFINMVVSVEDMFGIQIDPEELVMDKFCNIAHICDYLFEKVSQAEEI